LRAGTEVEPCRKRAKSVQDVGIDASGTEVCTDVSGSWVWPDMPLMRLRTLSSFIQPAAPKAADSIKGILSKKQLCKIQIILLWNCVNGDFTTEERSDEKHWSWQDADASVSISFVNQSFCYIDSDFAHFSLLAF
jgi:hypothetical protein